MNKHKRRIRIHGNASITFDRASVVIWFTRQRATERTRKPGDGPPPTISGIPWPRPPSDT